MHEGNALVFSRKCDEDRVMAMIVRAAEGVPGIPPGFPILLDDHMTIIEPAFAYLIEHATILGRSRAAETVRTRSLMVDRA